MQNKREIFYSTQYDNIQKRNESFYVGKGNWKKWKLAEIPQIISPYWLYRYSIIIFTSWIDYWGAKNKSHTFCIRSLWQKFLHEIKYQTNERKSNKNVWLVHPSLSLLSLVRIGWVSKTLTSSLLKRQLFDWCECWWKKYNKKKIIKTSNW